VNRTGAAGLTLALTTAAFAEIAFTEHVIRTGYARPWCVFAVDMDRDNDKDILSHAYGGRAITWWENDGTQNFTEHTLATPSGPLEVLPVDLDRDGDVDVVAALDGASRFAWYENDGEQNFTEHTIGSWYGAARVDAVDLDGDGDLDVLASACEAQPGRMGWFENCDSLGWVEHVVKDPWPYANSVHGADLDRDGDNDIVATASQALDLSWFENDGSGQFTEHPVIADTWGRPGSSWTVDIDRDSSIDLLATSCVVGQVAWFHNDGAQTFERRVVVTGFLRPHMVRPVDLDRDDDWDLVATSNFANEVDWFENVGSDSFVRHQVTTTLGGACGICPADLDDDGDVDILGAGDGGNRIVWYEQVPAGVEETRTGQRPATSMATVLRAGRLDQVAGGRELRDVTGRRIARGRAIRGVYFLSRPEGGSDRILVVP
jgi:hypothetical protein